MDKPYHSKSSEVNESLKYRELASIDSKLFKKINRFIIFADYNGKTEVFVITHSDDIYAFGSNNAGRLGFGHEEEIQEPKIIPELCGKKVIDIKCGYSFCVALTQLGKIYTFGYSSYGSTGNGNNDIYQKPIEISVDNQIITAIDCTSGSSFVLTQSGQLYWFGLLNIDIAFTPTKVVFPSEVGITSISCGEGHISALFIDGKVFSWGNNYYGQLGLGYYDTECPKMITLNENIKQIYCGSNHSLILTTNGKIYSMGDNQSGQLGIGNKENKDIPQLVLTDQKEICCYRDISMSFDINNKLYIWGLIGDKEVVSPVLSELTSFQEVIDTYSKYRSTLKTIEFLEPINSVIKTTTKMFDNPKNSDLKFKVKSKQSLEFKDIYCHKFFIEETTDYFQTMFAKNWSESQTNEILITDYSYEAYYQYLRSLYTNSIDSEDMEDLFEILSITEQYMDYDKRDKCLKLIKEKTNIENVCSVYTKSNEYNSDNLREYAFKIMAENMTDLVETQDYENMDSIYVKQFFTKLMKNNASK